MFKKIILIFCFFLISVNPATALDDDFYENFAVLTDVLSLIQNDYIRATDNWVLLGSAVKELEKHLDGQQLVEMINDDQMKIILPNDKSFIVEHEKIKDDDLVLIEILSELLLAISEEVPGNMDLIYACANGMVKTLDPHSAFISPDTFKELQAEKRGDFRGVGIVISIEDDILTIVAPIEGTPAFIQGLKSKDKILKINGEQTDGLSLMDATKKIRGPKGSKVTITVQRPDWPAPKDFTFVRDVIPLESVRSKILEPGYGYIRVTRFLNETSRSIVEALVDMKRKTDLKAIILDLRNNPGGLLDEAIKMSDLFLNDGIITSTKGRIQQNNVIYRALSGYTYDFQLVILVNAGSASGTEVVAAAMKDNKRALLIGARTFGKGSIQTVYPLKDGSALRITTSEFFTPNGFEIQQLGITPDLAVLSETDLEKKIEREADLENPIPREQPSTLDSNAPHLHFNLEDDDSLINFALDILKQTKSSNYEELLAVAMKMKDQAHDSKQE